LELLISAWLRNNFEDEAMAYTIDEVLNNPLVTMVERNDADRIYRIRLGELNQVITIRLKKSVIITGIEYSTSHVIKTPPQDGPYQTSLPFGDTPVSALAKAIGDLTSYYRAAIKAGFRPSDDWLQPS
jgi:hypothetical protein